MWGEDSWATKTHAPGLCALPTFACTGTNQLSLKFGQATEHSQHQTTMRRSCIGPSVFQAAEAGLTLADGGEHIEQVTCRARQPVEPCHQQHIARLEPANHLGQLGAISLRHPIPFP